MRLGNVYQHCLKGLEQCNCIFKSKQRKEISESIDTERVNLQQSINELMSSFGVDLFDIECKRKEVMVKQEKLKRQKLEAQAKSDKQSSKCRSICNRYNTNIFSVCIFR